MPERTVPWVLLRGLGREARHWGDFPARLAAASTSPVLTPDLPGNGRHWQQRSATTIAGQTEAVRAELAPDLAQGPVRLLALSLGGMVALDWAQRYPAEVGGLVLINTSLASLSPFWQRLRWRNYPALLCLPVQGLAGRERCLLQLTSNLPVCRAAALPDWRRWQQQCPVSRANLLRQLLAAARYRPATGWPTCPALLIASQRDRLVNPLCSQALAAATGWPLRLHPMAGHDLPLDAADWLVQTLLPA